MNCTHWIDPITISFDRFHLHEHTTLAVNESDTLVHGSIFIVQVTNEFTPIIANEIEEYIWLNKENYTQYTWAHLAEEFVQPWWLQLIK